MAIKNPPIKSAPFLLADWVEIRTLADQNDSFRLSWLKRYWDTHRETEDSDPSGQRRPEDDTDSQGVAGEDDDAFLDSINDELSDRANTLKNSYPFEMANEVFKLKQDITESGYIYLFCLLLSHWSEDEVLDGTWIPQIDNIVRDLFQACSTLAAAGYIAGNAISFGWPRPDDNPPFLRKLHEVYTLFGDGKVKSAIPPGASPFVKDEEIDIIAWQPSPALPTLYLLGQVASGENWEAKSIKGGSIDYFHRTWFNPMPISDPSPTIFIPKLIEAIHGGTRLERIEQLAAKFGKIFDRLLVPFYADKGIELADAPEHSFKIERRTDIPQIRDYVVTQKEALKAARAATR